MGKVLLVEDDLEFAELIVEFLSSKGIEVIIEDDPFKALVIDLKQYDLVLLDLGLPGIDGIELCEKFREKSMIPIIISSARSHVSDKIKGLKIGADDYLPKPYDPDELYARIFSLLRRVQHSDLSEEEKKHFVIDEEINDILYDNQALHLTNAEFEVLKEIIKHQGDVVSKEQILNSSLSIESTDGKSLEMLISKIRQKIKKHSDKKHIVAIRGQGYRIVI